MKNPVGLTSVNEALSLVRPTVLGMGSNRLDDVEVEVCVNGAWWAGWLDPTCWRRTADGRWEGYVRGTQGPAENRLGHLDQADIRRL